MADWIVLLTALVGEFTSRNVQDDLMRLLNTTSIPSTSTGVDPASIIRKHKYLPLCASRTKPHYDSTTQSASSPSFPGSTPYLPLLTLGSIQPRRIHHPHARPDAVYEARRKCAASLEPYRCARQCRKSKLGIYALALICILPMPGREQKRYTARTPEQVQDCARIEAARQLAEAASCKPARDSQTTKPRGCVRAGSEFAADAAGKRSHGCPYACADAGYRRSN